MVTMNSDPDAGGNVAQPDDGRDETGRLPEPLDAAHWPPAEDGPAVLIPGMPASQPAGTGPVVSTPVDVGRAIDEGTDGVRHRDDSAAAQGGPDAAHDISGTPIAEGAVSAPSAPDGGHVGDGGGGMRTDTHGAIVGGAPQNAPADSAPRKATSAKAPAKGSTAEADAKATNAKADTANKSEK